MNQLTYMLVVLMEECDEVSQRASKAIRFTPEEVQPGQELSNVERLRGELNDLRAVVECLQEYHYLNLSEDREAIETKKEKIRRFLRYSAERGTVTLE